MTGNSDMIEFLQIINTAASETIKSVTITQDPNQPVNVPWWNSKCQRAKALRRKALRNFQRCICAHHANLYSQARKECKETLRQEKQEAGLRCQMQPNYPAGRDMGTS